MQHHTCETCGGPLDRGRYHSQPSPTATTCLVCQVAASLADWQPPTQRRDYRDERLDEETTDARQP